MALIIFKIMICLMISLFSSLLLEIFIYPFLDVILEAHEQFII